MLHQEEIEKDSCLRDTNNNEEYHIQDALRAVRKVEHNWLRRAG